MNDDINRHISGINCNDINESMDDSGTEIKIIEKEEQTSIATNQSQDQLQSTYAYPFSSK